MDEHARDGDHEASRRVLPRPDSFARIEQALRRRGRRRGVRDVVVCEDGQGGRDLVLCNGYLPGKRWRRRRGCEPGWRSDRSSVPMRFGIKTDGDESEHGAPGPFGRQVIPHDDPGLAHALSVPHGRSDAHRQRHGRTDPKAHPGARTGPARDRRREREPPRAQGCERRRSLPSVRRVGCVRRQGAGCAPSARLRRGRRRDDRPRARARAADADARGRCCAAGKRRSQRSREPARHRHLTRRTDFPMTRSDWQHPIGDELYERAKRVIPGGIYGHQSPVYLVDGAFPRFLCEAEGCRVRDADGHEYVDFLCSYGPMVLGYRDAVVEAAAERQRRLCDSGNLPAPNMVELAEKLVSITAGADWAMFAKNGSDVCTWALAVARRATRRDLVAMVGGTYHGVHGWCNPARRGFPDGERSGIVTFPWNDAGALEELFRKYDGRIAGVIATPFRHEA